ncbi:hypothetical protein GGR52DRAFT_116690 [Hypoxylon sp. FL1284]|nr:hypothetical protein GGR52DRAFT_116690 [Hypoxylon sp. FL1284]
MYEGGVVLNSGRLLCHAVKTARKRDKAQVPLTLIGHGTGGIVVRSALCFSYSNQDRFGLILQKTKHVLFLDTPRSDLSQDAWKCISRGSSSEESIGGWKAWSTALARSHKVFNEMSRHFNITSAFAELDSHLDVSDISANLDVSGQTSLAREEHIILENTNHRTISQLSRGSVNYNWLVRRIQEGSSRITQNPEDIERIRVWIGRRPDVINRADQKRNLELHQAGTGNWLFEDRRFRQWATLGETSPLLWLTGPEGCGKSVLCSLATDRIRQSPQQHAIAYLMLAFDKPQSQYQILTQLALQLLDYVVRTQGGVDTEALLRLPEDHDTGSRVARIRDLIKVLVSQCPAVFFFIDGLDEVTSAEGLSSQPEQHTKLDKVTEQLYGIVSFLVDLAQADSATPVRLWLSSLKTDHISKWMQEFGGDELPADESAIALDVSHFFQDRMVKAEATESPEPDAMVSLCKAVGCNFLIASMITEEWQRSGLSSINGFRHSITDGVRELYADCLEKLKSLEKGTDQDDGRGNAVPAMHILSLLTSARRPLKMKEMREAVAILQKPFHDESEFCCEDLAPDDIKQLDGSDIERYCTPFVSFVPSEEETEDSYIRLSHVSVLHFLRELASSPVYEQGEPRIITNIMSDACLRYLSQRKYAITPEARTEAFQDDSFLAYAAKYWHRHLDESSSFPTEAVQSFICSPQFITVVQTQSLLLNGHFGRVDDDGKESQQVPASFSTRADLQALAHDYRQFIKEWSEFLQLGVTNARLHGAIQHCFWGALGETNFLWKHGSGIESNASFLLDFDASQDDNEAQESGTSYYYDMISEDGRRLAVWKIPIRRYRP